MKCLQKTIKAELLFCWQDGLYIETGPKFHPEGRIKTTSMEYDNTKYLVIKNIFHSKIIWEKNDR